MLLTFHTALHRSSTHSVLFTSEPVAAGVSRRNIQACSLAIAAYFYYWCYLYLAALQLNGAFPHPPAALRFTALALRDGGGPAGRPPPIAALGLLMDGCEVATVRNLSWTDPMTAVATLAAPTAANGYFFETGNASAAGDPIRWTVEARVGGAGPGGAEWALVGASSFRWDDVGALSLSADSPFPTPMARGAAVYADHRPGWPWALSTFAVTLVCGTGWLLMAAAGVFRRESMAARIWMAYLATVVAIYVAVAAACQARGDAQEAANNWLFVVPNVLLLAGLRASERRIILHSAVFGVAQIAAKLAQAEVLGDRGGLAYKVLTSTGLVCLGVSVVATAMRRYALLRARRLISEDRRRYDEAWRRLLDNPEAAREVRSVCSVAAGLRRREGPARQLCRPPPARPPPRGAARGWAPPAAIGMLGGPRPVNSLDQLYMQARCLEPLLLAKVKQWASASDGCFPVAHAAAVEDGAGEGGEGGQGEGAGEGGGMQYLRWADIERDPELVNRVRWGRIKAAGRAVEKVVRTYRQDVSRLVDVCRQSIMFETAGQLARCLGAVAGDAEVRVVRVKNRLDPGYNSDETAGFRNLCLNVRIVSAAAVGLGLDAHVCEVQLLLIPLALLMSDAGHRKYVEFRDLRGE